MTCTRRPARAAASAVANPPIPPPTMRSETDDINQAKWCVTPLYLWSGEVRYFRPWLFLKDGHSVFIFMNASRSPHNRNGFVRFSSAIVELGRAP